MHFQFVKNDAIDDVSRKQIRSHVMRGKNTGRRATRPTKEYTKALRPILQKTGAEDTSGSSDSENDTYGMVIFKPLGDVLEYFTFPVRLNAGSTQLIRRFMHYQVQSIYPIEFCIPMDVHKSMWFRFLQSSESFFHNTLAVAQHCVDTLDGRRIDSYEYHVYLANTYRCMNREFRDITMPSDPMVAAVASLLYHENTGHQLSSPKMHLDALERIVAIRGGLQCFPVESKLLLHKICRGDIDYAIHHGTLPRFFRDQFPYNTIPIAPKDKRFKQHLDYNNSWEFEPQLQYLHEELMRFCGFLNNLTAPPILDASDFEDALLSLAYRFLYLRSLNGEPLARTVEQGYHLGAVALLWTILFESGKLHRSPYTLLAHSIRDSVDVLLADGTDVNSLLLWLLLIGGVSILGSEHHSWLCSRIRCCAAVLQVQDWESARGVLKTFPWIDLIHSKPAERLLYTSLASQASHAIIKHNGVPIR